MNNNIKEEVWKDAVGYEGHYQISNHGRIKSVDRYVTSKTGVKRLLKGRIRKTVLAGRDRCYPTIVCSVAGKNKREYIHRLVARAFIENPEGKPEVNHVDGDKENNHVNNLEWVTRSRNKFHAYENKLKVAPKGESNGLAKLTEEEVLKIRDLHDNYKVSQKDISQMFNVTQVNVWNIVNRRTWKHI